jgi:hypothetical protein
LSEGAGRIAAGTLNDNGSSLVADERNPYAPPKARVADPIEPLHLDSADTIIPNGRALSAGRGAAWISAAWRMFWARPGRWLLNMLIFGVIYILPSQIRFGSLISPLLWPFVGAGIATAADLQRRTGTFAPDAMFAGLRRPTALLVLSALSLLTTVGLYASYAILVGTDAANYMVLSGDKPATPPAARDTLWALLLYLLFTLPIVAATYFAAPLIMLHGLGAGRAMKMSLIGSAKNILPGMVFSVCSLVFLLISAIPLGLGLLVSLPVMMITSYTMYREVFVSGVA